jgi:hypothetical protein
LFFYKTSKQTLTYDIAIAVGFMLSEAASGLPNGAFEAVVMVVIFFALNKILMGRLGWQPILIGYAFA